MSGGGSVPSKEASAQDWVQMVNEIQQGALSTRLGIPMIYGIDAVHGHNNVYNATIFPHNIGLGATRQDTLNNFFLTYRITKIHTHIYSTDFLYKRKNEPKLFKSYNKNFLHLIFLCICDNFSL